MCNPQFPSPTSVMFSHLPACPLLTSCLFFVTLSAQLLLPKGNLAIKTLKKQWFSLSLQLLAVNSVSSLRSESRRAPLSEFGLTWSSAGTHSLCQFVTLVTTSCPEDSTFAVAAVNVEMPDRSECSEEDCSVSERWWDAVRVSRISSQWWWACWGWWGVFTSIHACI